MLIVADILLGIIALCAVVCAWRLTNLMRMLNGLDARMLMFDIREAYDRRHKEEILT